MSFLGPGLYSGLLGGTSGDLATGITIGALASGGPYGHGHGYGHGYGRSHGCGYDRGYGYLALAYALSPSYPCAYGYGNGNAVLAAITLGGYR